MSNAKTKTVTLRGIMSSKAFLQGFTDVVRSNGWNYPEHDEQSQWRYERGRMFAVWLTTQGVNLSQYRLKAGRWVTSHAMNHYKAAKQSKAVL